MNKGIAVFSLIACGVWSMAANAGDVTEGEAVYRDHCASCHGADGYPQIPGVPDFSVREKLDRPDFELATVINSGSNMMPAFEYILTEEQILDVLAYLRTF